MATCFDSKMLQSGYSLNPIVDTSSKLPIKTGHDTHSSSFLCCFMYFSCCSMYFCVVLCIVCFVSFSVLFVCICVLNYCYRVATQLQLNISYHTVHILGSQIVHCTWCIYDMAQRITWWWLFRVETCRYMYNLTIINRCLTVIIYFK
jgi:hypothetical protein